MCVVELASLLAHEPFSDRPGSVCPALREFLQGYNDALPDHLRQSLYGLASDIVGTRAPARMTAWRARLCIGWGTSQAELENVSTTFGPWTLANCALAGSYSARAAQSNPWCHGQTLAFFTWLAHARWKHRNPELQLHLAGRGSATTSGGRPTSPTPQSLIPPKTGAITSRQEGRATLVAGR